jgi:RHS repeat-associated protein
MDMFSVMSETADPALRPRSARCTRSRGRRSLGLASGSPHRRRRTTSGLPFTNNGDLTNKTSLGQSYNFGYDLSSNLRNVQASGAVDADVGYIIDGMNRRIGKTVTPGAGSPVGDGLLYDEQGRVVAELSSSGAVLSTFVYGLKPNVPDYMVRGGVTYRIVSDWRGSVRLVLNTSETGAAAVVEQIDYDEWGNVTNLVDPSCSVGGTALCFQPFGFAGGLWEPATGVVRFGARDYDPAAGRWSQRDPLSLRAGTNVYEYAGDDPINMIDPTGRGGFSPSQLCNTLCGIELAACLLEAPEFAPLCWTISQGCFLNCAVTYPPTGPVSCNSPPAGSSGGCDPSMQSCG